MVEQDNSVVYAGGDAPRVLLHRYAELLSSCVTARLTGTRDAEEIYGRHIMDCMESLPFLPEHGPAIDVGSGGGLPGIVWAICRPDLEVTLLDSVGKKCRAMREIAGELGLANVTVLCARSEDAATEHREEFTLACARALANAGVTAELLSPLVRVGGTIITFKGPKFAEEIEGIKNGRRLGLKAPVEHPYGSEGSSLRIVTWEKIAPCPRAFPRKPGMAAMKGWWQ